MSHYWQVSIQSSLLLHPVILSSLGKSMPCESSQVRCDCLWMPRYVTPIPFVGWSCRCSLLMLVILGSSMWVFHATLKESYIATLCLCFCSPQCHIHRLLAIALLMVWKIVCCWLGPPWWLHVGGVSSIVGDLVNSIVGAVVVLIFTLSSVSGVAILRSIVLAGWHVLHDWDSQSTIPACLS